MINFQTVRDRDAWATIRGYVYQVDLTIERWLALNEGQVLELERGEDIDIVSQAIQTDSEDVRDRLLNQVKSREKKLSLRSSEAVEAVACFVEHRRANAKLQLRFLYTTNADITCERPEVFESKTPALTVWMQLHRNELPPDNAASAAVSLRDFLLLQPKPKGFNQGTWDQFRSFLESAKDSAFIEVIKNLEWETGRQSPEAMQGRVISLLMDSGLASSTQRAHELYGRLFLYVFKTICQKGLKSLTRSLLEEQLAFPPLDSDGQAMLTGLQALVYDLQKVVESHGRQIQQNTNMIVELQRHALPASEISAVFEYSGFVPEIQPPPIVKFASERSATIQGIQRQLDNCTWLAVHGLSGIGKSQFALLLTRKIGRCDVWVRLSSEPDSAASCFGLLEQSLGVATRCPPFADRRAWYESICNQLGENALIVVDDVPRLVADQALSEGLVMLCQACRHTKAHLLTTSPHPLSKAIAERLEQGSLLALPSPSFTDDEAKDILAAYGASAAFLESSTVTFINSTCQQNPSLLAAVARYPAFFTVGEFR